MQVQRGDHHDRYRDDDPEEHAEPGEPPPEPASGPRRAANVLVVRPAPLRIYAAHLAGRTRRVPQPPGEG
jgi:hypothetical protein